MNGLAGRIVADFGEMNAMAALLERVVVDSDEAVRLSLRAGEDLQLLAAGLADPVAVGRLAWQLLDVRDAPGGLRLAAIEVEALRAVISLAVQAYGDADAAAGAAQDWLVHHPTVIDGVVTAVTTLTGLSERQLVGLLAAGYPDGRPKVTLVARHGGLPPPRSLADIVARLGQRADISNHWAKASEATLSRLPPGTDDGTIDVSRLSGPAGTGWLVNLPGTSAWELPGRSADPSREHDPADFGGDLRLIAGEPTTYGRGVVDALRSLPIRPGEPVLLAGHSQGGMVALAVAATLARCGTPTEVLAAGSPVAGMIRPSNADVLALENTADIVPELDGASNPTGDGWATLRFTDQLGTVGGNHGFSAYAVGARLADRSSDPAVSRWRERARPFLTATAMRQWVFRIERVPAG